MKKKIVLVCIIGILSTFSLTTFAGPPVPAACAKIIKEFIDGHVNGNYKEFRDALDVDAVVVAPMGDSVIEESKAALVSQMRSNGAMVQNCISKYEIIAQSDVMVLARVDFDYGNATQHHFLVMQKNADKDWKIERVYEVINDKPETSAPANNVLTNN